MDMDIQSHAAQSLLAAAPNWLGLLSQDTRLIEIHGPPAGALVVERFAGTEAVCDDFEFTIDCLSASALLDSRSLLGRPLTLRLRQADGGDRDWHGYCTATAPLGSDGGVARYRLTMAPWTAFLRLRRNALIFQDLDALGVIERVFNHYPQAVYRVDVSRTLPVFPVTTQYRETDHDFVLRLLADAGLAWRFEHGVGSDSDAGPEATRTSRDTLVIFDRQADMPVGRPGTLRFHRSDATESTDAISAFAECRRAGASVFTTASWQAEHVEAPSATLSSEPSGPNLPALERYAMPRAGRFASRADAEQHAGHQLDALRLPQHMYSGTGSVRGLAAGSSFALVGHPALSGQRFLPLVIEHLGGNNLGSGIASLLGRQAPDVGDPADIERGSYRNRFTAVLEGTPIVPLCRAKPTAPGAQTARVVGLPDATITSNRDHQVRIQFYWQRGVSPNPGGITNSDGSGHAPGDHTSGIWVRVAESQAGANWGSHLLPRVGSDVLVEFLHGDIDQPVIAGQLYNGEVAPPFALADASNHPGTVSGLHSQSLDGSGSQQWLIDDAPGQLRQRLHTSLADSRLELGYLINANNASRGDYRGEGFDLASLGWANLRAGQGMLLSTSARTGATSTQLDVTEAVSQIKGAQRTAQALSDAAQSSEVAVLSANQCQVDLISAVDPEQDGHHPGKVNGQPATKPQSTQRDGGAPVERFATPLLFVESPDAIALATPNSALAYAGGNTHLTAQSDVHLAAGQTYAGVAGRHLALFAQTGPLRAIAAKGPVSLQAHAGPLELLADKSVTVTATDDRIDVLAKTKIVLQAGKTQVTLEGGNITFACPGTFTVKAGQVPLKGGAGSAAALAKLPDTRTKLYDQQIRATHALTLEPISDLPYKLTTASGDIHYGTTDEEGKTIRVSSVESEKVIVRWGVLPPRQGA